MQSEQLSLLKKKSFPAVQRQLIEIAQPTPESTILQTIPSYYNYLKSGGYSKYTPDDFSGDVSRLGRYLKEKQLQKITQQDIQQWIASLQKSLSEKTVSRRVSAITNYFLWLCSEEVLAANPTEKIYNARIISPLPVILFESECQQLYAAVSQDARKYLLLLLLLEAGIKKEELLNLQITHFNFSNKYAPEVWIKHTGKKVKKDRKLKLPPETTAVFSDYCSTYVIHDTLFPYSMRFMQYLLTDLAKKADVKKRVTASVLRDTYAVRCLNRGEDIGLVLKKLGLSETTWDDAEKKYKKLASPGL